MRTAAEGGCSCAGRGRSFLEEKHVRAHRDCHDRHRDHRCPEELLGELPELDAGVDQVAHTAFAHSRPFLVPTVGASAGFAEANPEHTSFIKKLYARYLLCTKATPQYISKCAHCQG